MSFDLPFIQEHGLYYDGNNGCYYSYNQTENKFEFHSQVYSTDETAQATDEKVIEMILYLREKKEQSCS